MSRKPLDDYGLSVPTVIALHGWLNTTGAEHQEAIEEAKRRMAQAAAVGSTYIISSPPREVADLQLGGKNYRELLELGREFGVKPAMEFLGFVDGVNQVKQAWEVMEVADHPDSTIVLDPFHIYRGGGEIEDMKGIPGEKIAVFHFNDAPADPARAEQSDADRVYPGRWYSRPRTNDLYPERRWICRHHLTGIIQPELLGAGSGRSRSNWVGKDAGCYKQSLKNVKLRQILPRAKLFKPSIRRRYTMTKKNDSFREKPNEAQCRSNFKGR